MRLVNGSWEAFDVLENCPDDQGQDEYLSSTGWSHFFRIGQGDPGEALCITVWEKTHSGPYLIEVENISTFGPLLMVDTFPHLMGVLALWAPVIQASAIATALSDAGLPKFVNGGLIELIGAKLEYGKTEQLADLEKYSRIRTEQAQAARHAERDPKV